MHNFSDQLLARIVSLATDAIICIDSEQRITFFNEGAQRIFGYAPGEVMGEPLDRLLADRFHDLHHHHIREFGASPVAARKMGERSLISGRRANGEEFPAEAAIAKIHTDGGTYYSVVLRDVTAQRQAERVNRELLEQMDAAVKARDDLLGLVSHDLRNPVNAVKMLAAAILRNVDRRTSDTAAEIADHASVMLQAANQMDALIQDLLDVTRLEAGRLRLLRISCNLVELIRHAVNTLEPLAAEREIHIDTLIDEPSIIIDADPDRIAQVLSNLIGNAVKFSTAGGRVTLRATTEMEKVTLTIVDTGMGIAEDELPMVFDRFWQSKRTNRSGAGLGLAIARGIVRAHEGTLEIDSALGLGTTVRVSLLTVQQ